MTLVMRRYLRSFGSVMNIRPSTDYRSVIKQGSDASKISGDVAAVGKDMRRVIKKEVVRGCFARAK